MIQHRPSPQQRDLRGSRRKGSRSGLLLATVAAGALLAPGAALAQEADLAARVARLEALVLDQQKRIEAQRGRAGTSPPWGAGKPKGHSW